MSEHIESACRAPSSCSYKPEHKHGFACDVTCGVCGGRCFPECPPYVEHRNKKGLPLRGLKKG